MRANKLIKNPRNPKEQYQSFIRKKNRKSVKQSEIIPSQPKTCDIVEIKSVIINHPKTSHQFSKAIRQAEKGGSNSSLYSDTKNVKLKGFKFLTTLVLVFKMIESEYKSKYGNFYSSSKTKIIINESDIDDVFKSIYTTIITNIQKSLGEFSGLIIDSVIDNTITISKYNPLVGSSYIKLPKELDHPRKDFINIQNTDGNECFKWCLVKYKLSSSKNSKR